MMKTTIMEKHLCLPPSRCSWPRAVPFGLPSAGALHRRYQLDLSIPLALAGAHVMLAGLPDILKPFSFPLPLGFTLGLLFPDLLFRRD